MWSISVGARIDKVIYFQPSLAFPSRDYILINYSLHKINVPTVKIIAFCNIKFIRHFPHEKSLTLANWFCLSFFPVRGPRSLPDMNTIPAYLQLPLRRRKIAHGETLEFVRPELLRNMDNLITVSPVQTWLIWWITSVSSPFEKAVMMQCIKIPIVGVKGSIFELNYHHNTLAAVQIVRKCRVIFYLLRKQGP